MLTAQVASPLPDAQARRRALLDHDRSLLVEAGAGSGKTSLLAGRVALLLAAGVRARDIVAITFTEAAAGELLERIELYTAELAAGRIPSAIALGFPDGISSAQSAAIACAVHEVDELTCTTIHGFCQRLIMPYPVEAHIDPGAKIADPATASLVHEELLEAWLSERFGHDRALGQHAPLPAREDDFLVELVRHEPREALSLIKALAEFLRIVRTARAPLVDQACKSAWGLRTAIDEFTAWYGQSGLVENKTAAELEDLRRLAALLEGVDAGPLDGRTLIALLTHERPRCCHSKEARFLTWRKKTAWSDAAKARGLSKTQGEMIADRAREHYDTCAAMYARFTQEIASIAAARFVGEFGSLHQRYADHKQKAGLLDFDDLLFHARDLLAGNEEVRQALARRYARVLVDEFQDTDPLQAEILWRLCGEGEPALPWHQRRLREGSLFLVGDPKQAIYRFRGADIDTYRTAKNALCAQHSDALLEVSANFRSVEPILRFVNERFVALLGEERGQPGFTALVATKTLPDVIPAVAAFDVLLDERHKDEKGKLVSARVREQEAEVVADLVAELIARRSPGDIALLAPTGTQLWVYERALDRRDIPIATQAGKGFFRRQEVQDLIALARVLADPRDTLALGALLRGPLVGLSEEEIADAMIALGSSEGGEHTYLRLWSNPRAVGHPILERTLAIVQNLAREAACTTPYEVMARAVEELDVRALLRARRPRAAERGLANVESFLEAARAYDARGLSAFARAMRRRWEEAESHVEGRPDSEREAVALITMHSSKGLEWPIVIPINTMGEMRERARFFHRRDDDTVHFKFFECAGPDYEDIKEKEKEQQQRERVRLWYVALTRARDLLLLPRRGDACGEEAEDAPSDWMSLVGLPLRELPTHPSSNGKAHGAQDTLASLEVNAQDAAAWEREAQTVFSLTRNIEWRNPSLHEEKIRVEPVSSLLREASEETLSAAIRGSRERGVLLHKLLEEILNGEIGESALEARARELLAQMELLEADDPSTGLHVLELADCVRRGLALPEIRELRPRLIPEAPVYASWEEGRSTKFLSGVVDALALDARGNVEVVIDWKSDVDPDAKAIAEYREQIREYLAATGASSGLLVFLTSGAVHAVGNRL